MILSDLLTKPCPKCGYMCVDANLAMCSPRITEEQKGNREVNVMCRACCYQSGFFPTAIEAVAHWNATERNLP